MIVFDLTYLFIGVADFALISLYMIEHENAARQFKGQPKKPYSHHFDSMFFIIFLVVILVFAYFAMLPAIYCLARLVKGWLGYSILSKGDKRKLSGELMVERRRSAVSSLLGSLTYNGGLEETGGIPPNATYPQAMAYLAIWMADNYAHKATMSSQIDQCKSYWLSLRYSSGVNGGEEARATALANELPQQVDAYLSFLAAANYDSLDYWPAVKEYIGTNLQ
ncbi:MAG: hypothetical protein AB8B86_00325 [Pseudomonadales bacterium]